MGTSSVSEKKKQQLFNHYKERFDSFDFRLSPSDELTFIKRANRELTGGFGPDDFLQKVYDGYRRFMVETCINIHLSKDRIPSRPEVARLTPAPLVDEMWQLAILYTEKYRELCRHMIGSLIHREPQLTLKGFESLFKTVWPYYDKKIWTWDRDFTVWIFNRDIVAVINQAYDYLMAFKKSGKIFLQKNLLITYLTNIRAYNERIVVYKNIKRYETLIPTNHYFFNSEKTGSAGSVFSKIRSHLPKDFDKLLSKKYCTSTLTDLYINEYLRFMVLVFFSTSTLTPSEEVDQVWHFHQSLTLEYENFCNAIFGKLIIHTPTAGGESEGVKYKEFYIQTIEFYKFVFKESPTIGLWPPVDVRFDPNNFNGSWISLVRIFQALVRVIENYKINRPQDLFAETMKFYYTWDGYYLFKRSFYVIALQGKPRIKKNTSGNIIFASGGSGCGASSGCGADIGCPNSGCGGSGCGGSGCGGSGCGGSGCGGGGCGGGGCGGD